MEQPDLFKVPQVLSPRLEWIKRHKVLLYVSFPDDPAIRQHYAAFDWGDWPDYEGAADYFAQEIACYGDSRIGLGDSEEEAILDLCQKRMVRHWTVEAANLPASDKYPRQALWEHMHEAHKLTLLDSELDEIIAKACACHPPPMHHTKGK